MTADEPETDSAPQPERAARRKERRRRQAERGSDKRLERKAARKRGRAAMAGPDQHKPRREPSNPKPEPGEKTGRKRRAAGSRAKTERGPEENATRLTARRRTKTADTTPRTAARQERQTGDQAQAVTADVVQTAQQAAEEAALQEIARDEEQDRLGDLDISAASGGRAESEKPIAVAVFASDPARERLLFRAIEEALKPSVVERVARGAEFVIDFGVGQDEGRVAARGRTATILVGGLAAEKANSQKLDRTAMDAGAWILPLEPLARRHKRETMFDQQGELSAAGTTILADSIGKIVRGAAPRRNASLPTDLTDALALADRPTHLLAALNWPGTALPRTTGVSFRKEAIENFLDGKVRLPAGEAASEFNPQFFRTEALARSAEHALYSLDFVTIVLTYWFAKANRLSSANLTETDDLLKARGVTASMLLTSVGETLVNLLGRAKDLRGAAWRKETLQRRAVAFESFLLCCRVAALRKIRFDQRHCGPIFRGLVELLEELRPIALPVGSSIEVGALCSLVALALPIRKTTYGATLLEDAIEWLCSRELDVGTSADGVWREGFAQHGSVLTALATLTRDLRQADLSFRPLGESMAKLARFADALLAEDGVCAAIDELPGAAYPQLQKTIRAIQKLSPPVNPAKRQDESRDVMLFRESGYFVSRSSKENNRPRSHLVVHARPGFRGGPSLSFSIGGKSLLIGGGTIDKRASREIRRASRLDPAAHNAIRVDGRTYAELREEDPAAVRIDKVWEQSRWAAVRMLDNSFQPVQIARTIIHLKPGHALIVVDELSVNAREARFEQFWHFRPSFQPSTCEGSSATFVSPEDGLLNAAFDGGAAPILQQPGTGAIGWTSPRPRVVTSNPYLVRERRALNALMGSFFQASRVARAFDIIVDGACGNWIAAVTSTGTAVRFAFADGDLRLVQ